MNIAFPLILIIAIVLPGILFNFFRQADPELKLPLKLDNVQNEIAKGFFFSIFLHAAAIFIHFFLKTYVSDSIPDINYRTVTVLLTGSLGEIESPEKTLSSIYGYPFSILLYFMLINLLGIISGICSFKIIRYLKLDHKYLFFRFDNPWFYLLSGEKAFFDEYIDSTGMTGQDFKTPDRFISVVIEQGESSYLYRGLLRDYYLNNRGGLDKLVLFKTHRRVLSDDKKSIEEPAKQEDKENDPRYYKIEGDYFIIESSEIKNINIEYVIIDIDEVEPEKVKDIEEDIVDISPDDILTISQYFDRISKKENL